MLLFVSLSKRLPKVKIEDCLWYRFGGKRKVLLENDEFEARIDPNDVYGMKRVKDDFYVILADDPEYVFPVQGDALRSLLNRSKAFRGLVSGIKVKTDASAPNRGMGMERGKGGGAYVVAPKRGEDADLTKAVRTINLPGASTISFMSVVTLPSGDVYTYYDASATYPEFDPKARGQDHTAWEDKIEKAAVRALKTRGLIIGAHIMKNKGEKIPTLILVSDDALE